MVMDTDLPATEAAEILFSLIGAGSVKAVRFLMVDALDLETLMEMIPSGGFVGVNLGAPWRCGRG